MFEKNTTSTFITLLFMFLPICLVGIICISVLSFCIIKFIALGKLFLKILGHVCPFNLGYFSIESILTFIYSDLCILCVRVWFFSLLEIKQLALFPEVWENLSFIFFVFLWVPFKILPLIVEGFILMHMGRWGPRVIISPLNS